MDLRHLGEQGLTTSALGYGAMRIALGDTRHDDRSVAAIRQAYDDGVTHFDTAELYGWGRGERLLGAALAPVRDDVTIATKFGFTPRFGADSRPDHIREVVRSSLQNLGTDHIDVLYQHRHDPAVPIEDVVGVMAEYVARGDVRFLGLSNTTPENIRRAHAIHPISVLQIEYSLFDRRAEAVFPLLDELGIGMVAYAPLARGFLTGATPSPDSMPAGDFRLNSPWWSEGNYAANVGIAQALAALASTEGATLSQLALAWLLTRRPTLVPIPGSGSADRVTQNNRAADLHLNSDLLERIDRIIPSGAHAA